MCLAIFSKLTASGVIGLTFSLNRSLHKNSKIKIMEREILSHYCLLTLVLLSLPHLSNLEQQGHRVEQSRIPNEALPFENQDMTKSYYNLTTTPDTPTATGLEKEVEEGSARVYTEVNEFKNFTVTTPSSCNLCVPMTCEQTMKCRNVEICRKAQSMFNEIGLLAFQRECSDLRRHTTSCTKKNHLYAAMKTSNSSYIDHPSYFATIITVCCDPTDFCMSDDFFSRFQLSSESGWSDGEKWEDTRFPILGSLIKSGIALMVLSFFAIFLVIIKLINCRKRRSYDFPSQAEWKRTTEAEDGDSIVVLIQNRHVGVREDTENVATIDNNPGHAGNMNVNPDNVENQNINVDNLANVNLNVEDVGNLNLANPNTENVGNLNLGDVSGNLEDINGNPEDLGNRNLEDLESRNPIQRDVRNLKENTRSLGLRDVEIRDLNMGEVMIRSLTVGDMENRIINPVHVQKPNNHLSHPENINLNLGLHRDTNIRKIEIYMDDDEQQDPATAPNQQTPASSMKLKDAKAIPQDNQTPSTSSNIRNPKNFEALQPHSSHQGDSKAASQIETSTALNTQVSQTCSKHFAGPSILKTNTGFPKTRITELRNVRIKEEFVLPCSPESHVDTCSTSHSYV